MSTETLPPNKSEVKDWRTNPPLSLEDKSERLARVRAGLSQVPKFVLTPGQKRHKKSTIDNLTEEATFAFNTLTAYDDSLDARVAVDSTDITNHLDAANTFRLLAKHSSKDARIFGETIPEYADILERIAISKANENILPFDGTNDILTDGYHPQSYEKRRDTSSALLFEEQQSYLAQKQWQREAHDALLGKETHDSYPSLVPEELTVDVRQITLLCDAQDNLRTSLAQDSDPSDKETRRENLNSVIAMLESPELEDERIAELPAATVIKKLTLAETVRTLGELSEDANPEDFSRNRENSIKFAINQLREAEVAINRAIENTPPEVLGLDRLKDKIRYLHDHYAEQTNMPQIGWTDDPLAKLPEFEVPIIDYIEHVPELTKARTRKKVGVFAVLSSLRR